MEVGIRNIKDDIKISSSDDTVRSRKKKDALDGIDNKKLKELYNSLLTVSEKVNLPFIDYSISSILEIAMEVTISGYDVNKMIDGYIPSLKDTMEVYNKVSDSKIFNDLENLTSKCITPKALWDISEMITDYYINEHENEDAKKEIDRIKRELDRLKEMKKIYRKRGWDFDLKSYLYKRIQFWEAKIAEYKNRRIFPDYDHPEIYIDFSQSQFRPKDIPSYTLLESMLYIIKKETDLSNELISGMIFNLLATLNIKIKISEGTFLKKNRRLGLLQKLSLDKNKHIKKNSKKKYKMKDLLNLQMENRKRYLNSCDDFCKKLSKKYESNYFLRDFDLDQFEKTARELFNKFMKRKRTLHTQNI